MTPGGTFLLSNASPSGWTHVVLNYIGLEDGQGIWIYYDGVQTGSDTTRNPNSYETGDGRIVIGRLYTEWDTNYASVQLDELIFFNTKLTDSEIRMLADF